MVSFNKILIANRGEIAVRIARTAKRLGIQTVAVYSDADKDAPHVRVCDEAIHIGPPPATESYLLAERIIEAAIRTGAEAVHPGYGFLSENAEFAKALEASHLVFIGPTADTIERMGSKSAAKDLMEAAGVPVAPGYQGKSQTLKTFHREAERIGYPVLLKATAGGGGKGMRLVERQEDLESALKAAKQEAKSAFGDDRFLIEKFISRARHLEVQIFGDGQGGVVHLFERDCSVQRRHQKIIEEAPAPKLPSDVRERLLQAGVEAGKAVNYRGAGTVEFLYDGGANVYFMEMNTRLQVEHPVSEMITGLDLVEWQFRVASGQGLPLQQSEIKATGHAFEARLYAEDPQNNFSPSIGTIETLQLPVNSSRVDSGVSQAQEITPHYDPMIAKIITHGASRTEALAKMRGALSETQVSGLQTNSAFLHRLCSDPDFKTGEVSTRYIDDNSDALFASLDFMRSAFCALALTSRSLGSKSGFRLNAPAKFNMWAGIEEREFLLQLHQLEDEYRLNISECDTAAKRRAGALPTHLPTIVFSGECLGPNQVEIVIDDVRQCLQLAPHMGGTRVFLGAEAIDVKLFDPLTPKTNSSVGESSLNAPMPGIVLKLFVSVGDEVSAGDPLLSMAAMKMEHTIDAPYDGTVAEIFYVEGDQIKDGAKLANIEPINAE